MDERRLSTHVVPGWNTEWKGITSPNTFPSSWQLVRLSDVVEINRDTWNPAEGTSIYYLDLTAISTPGKIKHPKKLAAVDAPSRARRRVRLGDILVSTVRPNLRGFARVREAPENLIASTGFAVLSPLDTTNGSWVYHHVMTQSFTGYLENATTGQAYPAVRPDDIARYPLPFPPLAEQQAIAAVLDSIDEAIERSEEAVTTAERLQDALRHELLTRGLSGLRTGIKPTDITTVTKLEAEESRFYGWLKEVNWHNRTAQLHRFVGPYIRLEFDTKLDQEMLKLATQFIEVRGKERLSASNQWTSVQVKEVRATRSWRELVAPESFLNSPNPKMSAPDNIVTH